jgi:parallel beta-helix repeat protein
MRFQGKSPSFLVAVAVGAAAGIGLAGCRASDGFDGCTTFVAPAGDAEANHVAIQSAFGNSQPGDVICFRSGLYALKDEVTLSTPNVELRGSRADRAVLDFAGQLRGANGMFVAANGFSMQHLTVKNSAGQGIRIQKSKGVTLDDITVTWDVGPSGDNGGYGIYPTESENVLIESSEVSYASDAGIYVGQSRHIIVRDNVTFGNVIGIEIENSADADVYDNDAHGNVGGILAFSLPLLPRKNCERVNIHDNRIADNNQKSFAAPGSIVSGVPSGTGVMIMAADDVVVHHNAVGGNDSIGIGLFSYFVSQLDDYKRDGAYNPFPHRAWIHDNSLSRNGENPHDQAATITGLLGLYQAEQLLWDGMTDPSDAAAANGGNCFSENGGASYRNLDFAGTFANSTTDVAPVTCTRSPLLPEGPYPPVPLARRLPTQPHDQLSAYGFFAGALADQNPAPGVIAYDVAASLYADQSKKLRFMALPPGSQIGFDPTGKWTFPDGTAFLKTFYFDEPGGARTLAETRIEMKIDGVWTLQTYLWDAAQKEATRFVAGRTVTRADGDYRVPSSDQCKTCHAENEEPVPIGPRTRQLNRTVLRDAAMVNQLDDWAARGLFVAAPPPSVTLERLIDPFGDGPLETRARSYLDANCAHCHSIGGTASSTNLRLDFATSDWNRLGVCKSPVSAGPGSGQLLYDVVPGDPDRSILVYRMRSTDPAVKMPQLPTMTSDTAGTALIADWIRSLTLPACPSQ